jgi:hypothetical protein
MWVLSFSTNFFWNISHSKKNWVRYNYKCILVFMQSIRYSCPVLVKLYSSRKVLQKFSNIEFQENPTRGNRFIPQIGECHWQKVVIWDLKKDWTHWEQKRASRARKIKGNPANICAWCIILLEADNVFLSPGKCLLSLSLSQYIHYWEWRGGMIFKFINKTVPQ